jgi:sugar/nucleoside kinase (ribokinase family)
MISIIGTIALDNIKTPKGEFNNILGGSATFAGTAASIFTQPNLIGIVGQDFPKEHVDYFKSRGMNIDGIEISDGKTFSWGGYYEEAMNEAFTTATDLNVLLEFDPKVPDTAKKSDIVFCANIDPVLQKKAIEQFDIPKLVVLDSMNFWIENSVEALKEALKLVDILIINDQEIRMLTGIDNIIEAMPEVIKLGPKRLIVKKGEHGSIMFNGTDYFICPAFPLTELNDPTGAGDSFAGGFIGALSQHENYTEDAYKDALISGTLVSSFTVQGFSVSKLKTVTKDMLKERYTQLKTYATFPIL